MAGLREDEAWLSAHHAEPAGERAVVLPFLGPQGLQLSRVRLGLRAVEQLERELRLAWHGSIFLWPEVKPQQTQRPVHYRDAAEMRHDPAMAPKPQREPGGALGSGGVVADQVIGQPEVQSLALAEPTRHVRIRWIIGLTLASLGMWMATQTPLQVVLALQLQDITLATRSSPSQW